MMKDTGMLRGSTSALAAVIHMDATVGFLGDRSEVVDLAPIFPASKAGYIWKRVFLKGKGHRA